MDATELKIDNLVYYNNKIITVESIDGITETINKPDNDWESGIKISDLEAIPLTEKWLLYFGFEKSKAKVSGCIYYILGRVTVMFKDGIFYFSLKELQSRYLKTIYAVHELQNLTHDFNEKSPENRIVKIHNEHILGFNFNNKDLGWRQIPQIFGAHLNDTQKYYSVDRAIYGNPKTKEEEENL